MQYNNIRFGNGIHVPYTSAERKAAKRRNALITSAKYLVAAVLVVFLLFPYVFMLCKSVMQPWEVNGSVPVHLFPKDITFSNYKIVGQFARNFGNTFIVIAINAVFIPLSACFVAYPLARHKFTGKKTMFAIIMATVMIPTSVLMVPQYTLYTQFGLTKKLVSLWIGAFWGGGALNIFLVIQFMRVLPKEMDAAAKIDGANDFQMILRIVLPLARPAIIVTCVMVLITVWNEYLFATTFLLDSQSYSLAGGLYQLQSNDYSRNWSVFTAASMLASLPLLLIFFKIQKYMVSGLTAGGVKA